MTGFLDDYQPVEDRLREFHDRFRAGRVVTTLVSDPGATVAGDVIIFRAELFRGDELRDTPCAATGYAHQRLLDKPPPGRNGPNTSAPERTSPWEVAETSAVGRALANMGFAPKGGRPSREEISKAQTVTDTSPVPHASAATDSSPTAENEPQRGSTGGTTSAGGVTPPAESSSEGVGAGFGEGRASAPSDPTVQVVASVQALTAALGGPKRAANWVNRHCHTSYTAATVVDATEEEITIAMAALAEQPA